jgi:hypothetical protein
MLGGAPVITVEVAGAPRLFILDTGSSISLIQPGAHHSKVTDAEVVPISVTGDKLAIAGQGITM